MRYNRADLSDLIVVIVLFKTKITESRTLNSLLSAAAYSGLTLDIVLYDNSPAFNRFSDSNLSSNSFEYVANEENGGVSLAYNEAYKIALKKEKKWLLLLDQDTELPKETLSAYLEAIKNYPEESLFVPVIKSNINNKIISPCIFKFMRGFYPKSVNIGKNSIIGHSVINCGICVSVTSFASAGGYNPSIKLDFSDFDFIERFKKYVSTSFVVIDLTFYHSLSTIQKQSLDQDKKRFRYYLSGGRNLANNFKSHFFIFLNAVLRSLKLTLLHKNLFFLKEVFVSFMRHED